MPNDFALSSGVVANGKTAFFAQLNNSTEPKFFVGFRTKFQQNFGIYNTEVKPGQEVYDPALFAPQFDFWAHFIYPTVMAESRGSYWCLNTYDRAKFTFSFMQYAAHVANGDFDKAFNNLCTIGEVNYKPRIDTVKKTIKTLEQAGLFSKKYKRAGNTFVDI